MADTLLCVCRKPIESLIQHAVIREDGPLRAMVEVSVTSPFSFKFYLVFLPIVDGGQRQQVFWFLCVWSFEDYS